MGMGLVMGWGDPKATGKLTEMRKPYGWGWCKPVLGAPKSLRTTPGTSWQPEGAGMGIGTTGHSHHSPGTGRGHERPGGVAVTF